ncbi:hypothetical protein KB1_07010 [Cutibacterium modestum]|uniref:Uncharacterized protein n=3 Tax=Cutibacterium modestum TaxID=2559073 RepID=A0AAD1NVR8_9ACTN|nr:hypothetical protein KB1_07010 [Cutibacterium modestum]
MKVTPMRVMNMLTGQFAWTSEGYVQHADPQGQSSCDTEDAYVDITETRQDDYCRDDDE